MKKTQKTMMTAAVLCAAANMAACTAPDGDGNSKDDNSSVQTQTKYEPSKEKHEKVYGPPPAFRRSTRKIKEEDSK